MTIALAYRTPRAQEHHQIRNFRLHRHHLMDRWYLLIALADRLNHLVTWLLFDNHPGKLHDLVSLLFEIANIVSNKSFLINYNRRSSFSSTRNTRPPSIEPRPQTQRNPLALTRNIANRSTFHGGQTREIRMAYGGGAHAPLTSQDTTCMPQSRQSFFSKLSSKFSKR